MMKSLFLIAASALAAIADASTTVAVLEFGKSGSVRRTLTKSTHTTVAGVASFWSPDSLQHADMTVVPDLFRKADGAVVIGISGAGVDLNSMPTVNELMQTDGSAATAAVVGHMTLAGAQGRALLNKVGPATSLEAETLVVGVQKECHSSKLSSVHVQVDDATVASKVDAQVAALIKNLLETSNESTILVHLVVEEEDGAARRRLTSRRLEDEQQDQDEDNGEDEDGDANNNNQNDQNGYYGSGYAYYDAYNNKINPYKTMFQIQYFNIVLWTAVGLTVILFYTVYMMMDMPLMPDTLLFGESAKLSGD